jgi:serine/threonine protein kinase
VHRTSCVMNEINILSEIRHPNIPKFIGKVYNPYTYNFGILCKYVNGSNLETLSSERYTLKDEDKWVILLKIAELIEYLHNLKICYNNLSPNNVIVKSNGKIYLNDFSLANFFNLKNQNQVQTSTSNTSKNKAFTMYSAPEVIYKTYHDPSLDIWSFGALVYFLFTNSHPWNNNFYEASEDIFHRKLFDISKVHDSDARNLIILCCNFDSNLRPTAGVIRMNLSFHISNFMKNGILLNKFFSHSKFKNKIENVFSLDSLMLYKEDSYNFSPKVNERNFSEQIVNHRFDTNVANEETNEKGKKIEEMRIEDKMEINKNKSKERGNYIEIKDNTSSLHNRESILKSSLKKEEVSQQQKLSDPRKIKK